MRNIIMTLLFALPFSAYAGGSTQQAPASATATAPSTGQYTTPTPPTAASSQKPPSSPYANGMNYAVIPGRPGTPTPKTNP